MNKHLIAFLAAISFSITAAHAVAAAGVCEREMSRAANRHGVPLGILFAVGLTESGRRGSLQPYAMNIEGDTVFAKSKTDALRTFEDAVADGKQLIDLGCMQINHHYHKQAFSDVGAMFDPAKNVDYAARFLKTLRQEHGSWSLAVARYHAGPANTPAQKKYICSIIRNLVASGFGLWTDKAKAFCGA
jgi:soluble lytic murein transglycosylase-like protein